MRNSLFIRTCTFLSLLYIFLPGSIMASNETFPSSQKKSSSNNKSVEPGNPGISHIENPTAFLINPIFFNFYMPAIAEDSTEMQKARYENEIIAVADFDTTLVNKPVTIKVLANDINPEGDPLIVSLCGYPSHGIVVLNSDKTITYTPYAEYQGDDFLCYRICNALKPLLCDDTLVYIHVKQPDLSDLIAYSGISPNGDGNNDTWKIKGIEKYPDNTVNIFNRWGDKVREFSNYNNTSRIWNGTNEQGEPLPNGTYYYILDVKNVGVLKGWIFIRGGNE